MKASQKRHLLKTVTWRIIGTLDTILLGWLITGNPLTGVTIGGVELITKMSLYYFHERAWYKIDWGIKRDRSLTNVSWKPIDSEAHDFKEEYFFENKTDEGRHRLKVVKHPSLGDNRYRVFVSYKNRDNEFFHDLFEGTEKEIEDFFNIKLK